MKTLFSLLIFLFAIQTVHAAEGFEETMEDDPRLVRTSSSPDWLAAVGKFYVQNHDESYKACSIILVSANSTDDARIGLSAGHCIRCWSNGGNDETREFDIEKHYIRFTTNDGSTIERQVMEVAAYQSSPGDYAILVLNKSIRNSDIQPLVHSDENFKTLLRDMDYHHEFKPFATAAGYSTDITLGDKGKHLTYHEDCWLNGGPDARKDSRCTSYKGASGGAIEITVERSRSEWTDMDRGTEYLVVGIIQGGRDGHNESTFFTPWDYYDSNLRKAFKAYGFKRIVGDW